MIGLRFFITVENIPPLPGAYLLSINMTEASTITRPTHAILSPGRYLYAGSAYGAGGLRARISRHLRRVKRCHWHIDQIMGAAEILGAWVSLNGNECELLARYARLPSAVAGFGSSDCDRCHSHLLGPTSLAT